MSTLIAYYSYSGNTEQVAREIQELLGAELFQITPAQAYSTDYDTTVQQAQTEISEGQPRPIQEVVSFADYDTVVLGTPIWWSTMAPPVRTLLGGNAAYAGQILPFVTHGSGGAGTVAADIGVLCPAASVGTVLSLAGADLNGSTEAAEAWLQRAGLL